MRADLPRGLAAAMIVHAAGESVTTPLGPETYAVVLTCKDEAHLARVTEELHRKGVALVAIREPDRGNELMALGLRPARKEDLRRHVSSLPLLR